MKINRIRIIWNLSFIIRLFNYLAVLQNRLNILRHTNTSNYIFLKPVPPPLMGGGNIEHFYHFIFDLVVPINYLIESTSKDVIFSVKSFGILTDHLKQIFPNRINVESNNVIPKFALRIQLIGNDPHLVKLKLKDIVYLKTTLFRNLDINQCRKPNMILLIERLPADPYYIQEATRKGSGAARRSIINHQELVSKIASLTTTPFEFQNIQLEKLSFKEQIQLFDKALIVIGQHGAGLSNCIWMKQKSNVIELSDNYLKDHFKIISKIKNHNYFLYKTCNSHITIDVDAFSSWILSIKKLKIFFQIPVH